MILWASADSVLILVSFFYLHCFRLLYFLLFCNFFSFFNLEILFFWLLRRLRFGFFFFGGFFLLFLLFFLWFFCFFNFQFGLLFALAMIRVHRPILRFLWWCLFCSHRRFFMIFNWNVFLLFAYFLKLLWRLKLIFYPNACIFFMVLRSCFHSICLSFAFFSFNRASWNFSCFFYFLLFFWLLLR